MNKIIRFLGIFIKNNPVRCFLIFLLPFVGYFSLMNMSEKTPEDVVISVKDNGKYIYICRNGSDYNTRSFDTEQKLDNDNRLFHESLKIVSFLGIIYYIVVLGLVFLTAVIDDSETNWNAYDCWIKALLLDVKCEEEDGNIYYTYKNRLIYTHNIANRGNNPDKYAIQQSLKTLDSVGESMFPEFKGTKVEKREKNIKEILNALKTNDQNKLYELL